MRAIKKLQYWTSMIKVAITQRISSNEKTNEISESLDINYAKALKTIDILPVVLPYEVNFRDYFSLLDIEGIILSGGNDLSLVNSDPISKMRDKFELSLISYAIENKIPILGICRGMQVIASYFGAKLTRVDNQVGIKHSLNLNEKSNFYDLLVKLDKVNSYHNFKIENLPDDFIVSARDHSGVIKAIEHKKYRIFGQMWHSEREEFFNHDELFLIKYFFQK